MNIRNADSKAISGFLAEIRSLLSSGQYDFVPRRKNLQAIARLGLTVRDVKRELLHLTVADYFKGPKKDFDAERPGEIWEFKKTIEDEVFYVKLKIVQENGQRVLKCLGFHEDEFG